MSIEVILREHVEHLGDRGEIVKVASGYARNFLLPRKLALVVTPENKKQIERERAVAEAKEAGQRSDAQALAAKLAGIDIVIPRRVGEKDTLFGSVTSVDIADALAALQLTVDRRKIQLPDALRTVGEHKVHVKLFRDVTAELTVKIVPAE
jgi:large subunit ribosomal protein L9